MRGRCRDLELRFAFTPKTSSLIDIAHAQYYCCPFTPTFDFATSMGILTGERGKYEILCLPENRGGRGQREQTCALGVPQSCQCSIIGVAGTDHMGCAHVIDK